MSLSITIREGDSDRIENNAEYLCGANTYFTIL